tara:strand:+ start:66 stop:200 length:135 start_codon:yes stop_codon:yes gene_type:complete
MCVNFNSTYIVNHNGNSQTFRIFEYVAKNCGFAAAQETRKQCHI